VPSFLFSSMLNVMLNQQTPTQEIEIRTHKFIGYNGAHHA
jgi:hypothetical protein